MSLPLGLLAEVVQDMEVVQDTRTCPPRLRRCPPNGGFLLEVVQSARTCPPRFALPPRLGGLLGEEFGVEVRIGRPRETHRKSRSSRTQNTNV